MRKGAFYFGIGLICFTACRPEYSNQCNPKENALKERVNYKVGVAVDHDLLGFDLAYEELVHSQFNSLSPENAMKASYIHPAPNQFDWYLADRLVNFAEDQGIRFHGHTLIWHQQLPEWIENFAGDREQWRALLEQHIKTIVNRYKGRVTAWDVVNEAFMEDGSLRNSIWYQHLGASYIRLAFEYAHEADPDALLFYNDYNLAQNPLKRKAVIRYLEEMKLAGVPIDGIGCQFHINIHFPEVSDLNKCMEEVCQAGFKLHISELDIALNPFSRSMPQPKEADLKRQADRYLAVFKAFDRQPNLLKYGITMWGLSDADSWIPSYFNREDYPLLFDGNYQAKAAYCKLIESL